jgi:CheY-like chemotaxis protein
VLTDMMMPVMDGPAMIQELVVLNPQVRIIGASGVTGADNLTAAGVSFTRLLAKSYTARTLLTAISAALS